MTKLLLLFVCLFVSVGVQDVEEQRACLEIGKEAGENTCTWKGCQKPAGVSFVVYLEGKPAGVSFVVYLDLSRSDFQSSNLIGRN